MVISLIVCYFIDDDTMVFIDFRADRMRQIVEAFGIKPQFDTDVVPKDLVCLRHGQYVYVLCICCSMSLP